MEQQRSIGNLARVADTKVETIRYYEKIGLLPAPMRTEGNYRSYADHHLDRLCFIRRARSLGFTLDQVRDLLDFADKRDRSCAGIDEIARAHLATIERKLADLHAMQRELADVIERCGRGTVADCRIIEALAPNRSR